MFLTASCMLPVVVSPIATLLLLTDAVAYLTLPSIDISDAVTVAPYFFLPELAMSKVTLTLPSLRLSVDASTLTFAKWFCGRE